MKIDPETSYRILESLGRIGKNIDQMVETISAPLEVRDDADAYLLRYQQHNTWKEVLVKPDTVWGFGGPEKYLRHLADNNPWHRKNTGSFKIYKLKIVDTDEPRPTAIYHRQLDNS